MKPLHVTATISSRGGGVAGYIHQLLLEHAKSGCEAAVFALDDAQVGADTATLAEHAKIITHPPTGLRSIGWSRRLAQSLQHDAHNYDLIHLHGLRTLLNAHARRLSRHYDKPLIISPHGQLYPQVLAQGRLRKAAMARLFVDANLASAACIHATSDAEAQHIRAYGVKGPIAVVPIGVNLATFDCDGDEARRHVAERFEARGKTRRVLFLSLLHTKKGLSRLAQVWGELATRFPDWQLVIAGPDAGYEAKARQDFARSGQLDSVVWAGPVYGREKTQLLAGCDVMILPSDWENFGIVVIEALAAGTPVITTTGAPWGQLPERGCGWWVEPEVDPLAEALGEAMSMGDAERRAMGARGRALVEEQYTWERCAAQMLELYEAAIAGGDWPGFVGEE